MRVSSTVIALLTASASGLGLFRTDGDQSIVVNDELDVPGQSPLKYCDASRDDDIIEIQKVDLVPNPPEAYVKSSPTPLQRPRSALPTWI